MAVRIPQNRMNGLRQLNVPPVWRRLLRLVAFILVDSHSLVNNYIIIPKCLLIGSRILLRPSVSLVRLANHCPNGIASVVFLLSRHWLWDRRRRWQQQHRTNIHVPRRIHENFTAFAVSVRHILLFAIINVFVCVSIYGSHYPLECILVLDYCCSPNAQSMPMRIRMVPGTPLSRMDVRRCRVFQVPIVGQDDDCKEKHDVSNAIKQSVLEEDKDNKSFPLSLWGWGFRLIGSWTLLFRWLQIKSVEWPLPDSITRHQNSSCPKML